MNSEKKTNGDRKPLPMYAALLGIAVICLIFFTIPSLNVLHAALRADKLAKAVTRTHEDIASVEGTLDAAKSKAATVKSFEMPGKAKKEIERLSTELAKLKHSEKVLQEQLQTYRGLLEAAKPKPSEDGWVGSGKNALSLIASVFGAVAPLFSGIKLARSWLQQRKEASC